MLRSLFESAAVSRLPVIKSDAPVNRSSNNLDSPNPIAARLWRPRHCESANPVRWTNYVDLAIEPELVVRFGSDLDPERLADADIVAAIESVSPGIELHHFRFWQGRPTSQELIVPMACSPDWWSEQGCLAPYARLSERDFPCL